MHIVVELGWLDRKDVYTFGYRSGRFFHRCTHCNCPVKRLACGGVSARFREEHCSDAAYGVGKYTHALQKVPVWWMRRIGKNLRRAFQSFFWSFQKQNEMRRKKAILREWRFFLCSHFGVFFLVVFGYHELYPHDDGRFRLVLSFGSLISGSLFLFLFSSATCHGFVYCSDLWCLRWASAVILSCCFLSLFLLIYNEEQPSYKYSLFVCLSVL